MIDCIAEIGVNHNGSIDLAQQLMEEVAAAGFNTVKFQLFSVDQMILEGTKCAEYQTVHTGLLDQYSLLKNLELSVSQLSDLKCFAGKLGLKFLASPFSARDFESLESIGLTRIKLASGEINNTMLLQLVAESSVDVIISTGASTIGEVKEAFDFLIKTGFEASRITLMQCTSCYPCPIEHVNLRVLKQYEELFHCQLGFSDHTPGMDAAPLAVALGAKVIEKHVTLDKDMSGPDHAASLDIRLGSEFIKKIRDAEIILGAKNKAIQTSEKGVRKLIRKGLYADKPVKRGDRFSAANIAVKRPEAHLSASKYKDLLEVRATRDYCVGDPINEEL